MRKLASVLFLTFVVMVGCSRADLVTNGGFETGNFTGWTQGGATDNTDVCMQGDPSNTECIAHSGNFAAELGPIHSDGTLSQTLTTTPSQLYTVSFWLANCPDEIGVSNPRCTPNDFSASFGGTTFASLADAPAFSYTQFEFSGLASSSSTDLTFSFRQSPDFWYLDDVSVVPTSSSVPEPSSLLLLGTGILGTAGALKRKLLG